MRKRIATPSSTKEILNRYQLTAKKNYGQNFLVEPSIVDKIAREAIASENTLAIEIGPGIGALTQCLCEYAKHVIAFEIDERLIEVLHDTLQDYDNVDIRLQDFLDVSLVDFLENYQMYDVVIAANLPYYITTPILFKIFESKANIQSVTVMMQKEVADRFKAKPNTKDYNALSVITQYRCHVEQVLKVPRLVFQPKPKVDSSVLRFTFKDQQSLQDEHSFFDMVKACFQQRRKTIRNNYGDYLGDKQKASDILAKAGIKEDARAESLQLEEFIHLYEVQENDGKSKSKD